MQSSCFVASLRVLDGHCLFHVDISRLHFHLLYILVNVTFQLYRDRLMCNIPAAHTQVQTEVPNRTSNEGLPLLEMSSYHVVIQESLNYPLRGESNLMQNVSLILLRYFPYEKI